MSIPLLLLSLSPFHPRPSLLILTCLLGWLTPLMLIGQECPPPVPLSPPWLTPPSELYQHHAWVDGQLTSAKVYVLPDGPEAFRPFVFVEGIDFGLSGEASPWRNGDFGWAEFWGCDPVGYPMMASMSTLVDSLVQRGFTPVLIDFEDGDADLFVNAELLIDILQHLRDHRTDPRPMVVSGASMGGQLARIALRTMELRGEPTSTALYVSLDSPHRGRRMVPLRRKRCPPPLPPIRDSPVDIRSQLLRDLGQPMGPRKPQPGLSRARRHRRHGAVVGLALLLAPGPNGTVGDVG